MLYYSVLQIPSLCTIWEINQEMTKWAEIDLRQGLVCQNLSLKGVYVSPCPLVPILILGRLPQSVFSLFSSSKLVLLLFFFLLESLFSRSFFVLFQSLFYSSSFFFLKACFFRFSFLFLRASFLFFPLFWVFFLSSCILFYVFMCLFHFFVFVFIFYGYFLGSRRKAYIDSW